MYYISFVLSFLFVSIIAQAETSIVSRFAELNEEYEGTFTPVPGHYANKYGDIVNYYGVNLGYLNIMNAFREGESSAKWLDAFKGPIKATFKFEKLTDNGLKLVSRYEIQSDKFKENSFLVSGKNYLATRFVLDLKNCDGIKPGVYVDISGSLESIVQSLRSFDFKDSFRCEFQGDYAVLGDEVSPEFIRRGSADPSWDAYFKLSLIESNDLILSVKGLPFSVIQERIPSVKIFFQRKLAAEHVCCRQNTMSAAEQFVEILKSYGSMLDEMQKRELPPDERDKLARAWFKNNLDVIKEKLNAIDSNFAALSIRDKLAISWNISNAYALVRTIELKTSVFLLDVNSGVGGLLNKH